MHPAPKPPTDPAALHSEAARQANEIAVEAWGDGLRLQVIRLCTWARDNGMAITCEK